MSETRFSRRGLLATAGGVLAGAALGGALATRFRSQLDALKLRVRGSPLDVPDEAGRFRAEASAIADRHDLQDQEDVVRLKRLYARPVFGPVAIWDLIQRLALCVDRSDARLFGASQLIHAQQVVAGMQANGVDDPDMLLLGWIHDLGKVLLLDGAAPENVLCGARRIAGGMEGAGLGSVVFQFGHAEFIYTRVADHVPEHIAFAARYHNIDVEAVRPFMDAREREWTDRYLLPFKRFDASFASPFYVPRLDLEEHRALLESYFPKPVLV